MTANVATTIWDALAMGKANVVRLADTSAFDWKASHPHFGSVTHAILFGRIDETDAGDESKEVDGANSYCDFIIDTSDGIEQRMALLQFAMERGASPYISAPHTCDILRTWCHEQQETLPVCFAGKTAVESLLTVERAIKKLDDWEADWSKDMRNIEKALTILSKTYDAAHVAKVAMPECLLDLWARVLADTSAADVAISVRPKSAEDSGANADASGCELHAHRAVLQAASPVLGAMLAGAMCEGAQQKITLEDCSLSTVKMLLSLLYTGSLPGDEEPVVDTMLETLMLGHRWQVQHVVDILVSAIARSLDTLNFETVMAASLRLQAPELLSACKAFIGSHVQELSAKLNKKGKLGFQDMVVAGEVQRALQGECAIATVLRQSKRRRLI